jgi:nucleotide-binding universal stress UspA family protein
MSYRTILAYVDADGMPEARIRLAADLADRFRATLIGLSATAFRPTMMVEGVAMEGMTEAAMKEISSKLARKGGWFRDIVRRDHRNLEWRPVFDFPADALAREARSADLVVLGRTRGPGDGYSSLDPGGTILRLGRPALVVPEGIGSLRADHIVIGWKDTREARRAVVDALPILQDATRVTVMELRVHGADEAAALKHLDDVASYLKRHRVIVGPSVTVGQEGSGAAQLIRHAHDERADLLVTGAYGHSRLGEWVFGGMTHDLLASSPICCLMSH